MIIFSVAIKAYFIMTLSIIYNEIWNFNHPRPFPVQKYYALKWEYKDFYTKKYKGQWILRKYRKTDSETKRFIREKYWEEIYERSN